MIEIIPDDNFKLPCISPEHNPPGHIVISPGSKMVHICLGCGQKSILRPSVIAW